MKIGLIKGTKGLKHLGGGVNYSIYRLYQKLKKKHQIQIIYGNGILPVTLGYLPIGKVEGYDIVHAGAPEFAALITSKSPIIATFYDNGMCGQSLNQYLNSISNFKEKVKIMVNKQILRLLIDKGLKNCKKIVAISEESKQMAIKAFKVPENKIVVIPPGVDTKTFYNIKSIKKDNKELRLFFCGGISHRKGIDNLLQAVNILKKEFKIKLWLAGSIHPAFNLDLMVKQLNLATQVKYYGHISSKKLNLLYNQTDIFVMPSRFEGYGIPILEALVCRTKVVSTLTPSAKLFRKFLTIIDSTPQSIADGIRKSMSNKTDFTSVIKIIKKSYSINRVVEKHIALYNKIIKR